MSGGRWDYRDRRIADLNVQEILNAVMDCLHQVDYAECGDVSLDEARIKVYSRIRLLGDQLFNG